MLVIDASALAALLMPKDGGEGVEKAVKKAERVSTLDLAAYEVGNAVWRRVRRGGALHGGGQRRGFYASVAFGDL